MKKLSQWSDYALATLISAVLAPLPLVGGWKFAEYLDNRTVGQAAVIVVTQTVTPVLAPTIMAPSSDVSRSQRAERTRTVRRGPESPRPVRTPSPAVEEAPKGPSREVPKTPAPPVKTSVPTTAPAATSPPRRTASRTKAPVTTTKTLEPTSGSSVPTTTTGGSVSSTTN